MDRNRKWRFQLLAGLQVAAAAAIAGAVICLLYRYVQYGERAAREAEANLTAGMPETEASGETDFLPAEIRGEQPLSDLVRVQILDDDFAGEYHEEVSLSCEKAFVVNLDGRRIRKGKVYRISADGLSEGQVLRIRQKDGIPITVDSLARADGHPQYAGTLWLYRRAEGLLLVNELPLEEYLCGVVSSEMPSDYPLEAQKAQAVCARTYACNCIRNARQGNSLSDLDDSVNYQVYNNYRATETSRQAVRETAGETLPKYEILYYSTSCQSERREDLGSDQAFREFLSQEPDAGAEYDSPWLRWETEISAEDLLRCLKERYGWQADYIDGIRVSKRAGNGQAEELEICWRDSVKTVEGEYAIRQALSAGQAALHLRNGEEHAGMPLLPSAFFWLEVLPDTKPLPFGARETDEEEAAVHVRSVTIHGGGYGHGIGMSQCGAAALAGKGMDYREILDYYYE